MDKRDPSETVNLSSSMTKAEEDIIADLAAGSGLGPGLVWAPSPPQYWSQRLCMQPKETTKLANLPSVGRSPRSFDQRIFLLPGVGSGFGDFDVEKHFDRCTLGFKSQNLGT